MCESEPHLFDCYPLSGSAFFRIPYFVLLILDARHIALHSEIEIGSETVHSGLKDEVLILKQPM